MVIRLARQSDLPSISKILAIGFHDEEVAGPILHPYRIQYPNDYLTFWRRRTFVSFWDYSRAFLVSCENDEKTGKELVVGVAEWTRVGLGWEKLWKLWGPLDPRRLIRPILSFFNRVLSFLRPNRAASKADPSDPLPLTPDTLQPTLFPFIAQYFSSPPHRQTRWYLESLAVLPEYRGRSHGRDLVAWGMDRARQEGIPAGVMAAADRERFYERCGFTEVAGWANDGFDDKGRVNPLKGLGVRGGCIMYSRVKADDEWEEENKLP